MLAQRGEFAERSTTAIGTRSAMPCQFRHLWKLARLSAPMIQTKRTPRHLARSQADGLIAVAGADQGL